MVKLHKWREHNGPVRDHADGFDVIECQRCEYCHVVPLPEPDQIEQIYRDEYYSSVKPNYFTRTVEDLEWWNAVYDEWYEGFEAALPVDRRCILDVGCGPGHFLVRGKERGWTTVGVEPSKHAAAFAQSLGLTVRNKPLTASLASELGAFDVVHLHEVLEHLADPLGMLQLVYGLVNPGGFLSVVVPNDYNPLQSLMMDHRSGPPWWVVPPHHLNYFSGPSLKRLVQNAQFTMIRRTATFPLELFLLMGEDYIGNDAVGRTIHAKRKRLELAIRHGRLEKSRRRIYATLARLGIGREIVLVAQKAA